MTAPSADLAIFVASLFHGGVGKMRVHLMNEFARRGVKVDLLLAERDSPYMDRLDPAIRVVDMPTSNALTGVPFLAAYLFRRRPRVLLAQRLRVNALALRARAIARVPTRVFVTANTHMTTEIEALKPAKRPHHLALLRDYFPRDDGIISVSNGVAEDLAGLLGWPWPTPRIQVAPNPVVSPELYAMAAEPLDHPWLAPGEPPVVLGVGRLEPQKDFPTLLRAFARVRRERPCRLVILGEGKLRGELQDLAAELGVSDNLAMPGFVANPYQWMARASLFVLSSLWEGSPNGLTEALAVGVPLVATDCPSGPFEILEGGRWGPLVPMSDPDALAAAMLATLAQPPAAADLRQAAQRYTLENSASRYLEIMGLGR
ncbi:glycosyltransferase [Parasulfuritortus cantonensis]|uniref:Glycosyltransferase n=1 Tax=Parasulfuritortus cantonensis TaxID=2528202 RepID=A0A4R1BE95_9PROT|nr:glycosyltransferase [Parasulfuritortus cantonensis]TCJ15429.1 glycosyltransferase [Parasulfuritortus cantonensis]